MCHQSTVTGAAAALGSVLGAAALGAAALGAAADGAAADGAVDAAPLEQALTSSAKTPTMVNDRQRVVTTRPPLSVRGARLPGVDGVTVVITVPVFESFENIRE